MGAGETPVAHEGLFGWWSDAVRIGEYATAAGYALKLATTPSPDIISVAVKVRLLAILSRAETMPDDEPEKHLILSIAEETGELARLATKPGMLALLALAAM